MRNLASKLRHRITFQNPIENDRDSDGFMIPEDERWTDLKTVWAAIKTIKGREFEQAAATQNENTIRFIIRYTTGLNPDMRIKYDSRFFDIESIINDDELNKTLTVIAKELIS